MLIENIRLPWEAHWLAKTTNAPHNVDASVISAHFMFASSVSGTPIYQHGDWPSTSEMMCYDAIF